MIKLKREDGGEDKYKIEVKRRVCHNEELLHDVNEQLKCITNIMYTLVGFNNKFNGDNTNKAKLGKQVAS